MADCTELYESSMQELNDGVNCDSGGSKEEADLDAIPPSLLSYFETSKSRAAVCEKLILEEAEDFTAWHHTEDMMNLPNKLDKDMMKLNGQVTCDAENKQNSTHLLPAPTETEAHVSHNVSVCPNNKDEAGTDGYMDSEKHLTFEVRTLESSLNEDESKKSSEYKAEREKRHLEEIKREEQKKQTEKDFQKELRKIMEAEKLHQKEFELMEKRAHEKLEQEFLLQQELISNLQRRVEEERRMREEEEKRMKDEEDKRKREEEKIKIEAERKRMEEETRRKKEDRKMEELELKKEKRKNEEEKKRRMKREEKQKREEESNRIDSEKKKLEDKMRMMEKEKEERENKEEVERIKKEEKGQREEEREVKEEARKEMEKEERNMEEEISLKKEEDGKKKEEDNMRIEQKGRVIKESEVRKKQEEIRKKKEEEEADDRQRMAQMEEDRKKREVEEKEEARDDERKKMKEKEVKDVVRKQEEENRKMKEELRLIEEDEKRKREAERKTKEEKWRRRQKEEMRQKYEEEDRKEKEEYNMRIDEEGRVIKESEVRKKKDEEADNGKKMAQMEEEDRKKREVEEKEEAMERKEERENRKMEEELIVEDTRRQKEEQEDKKSEEMKLKEDKEGYDVECRQMGHESKTKDKEKKREEERKNVEAKKEQNGEEGDDINPKTEDEMRLKEKEESKKRTVQEKEVRVTRANELQEKMEHNSTIGQNENYCIDKAGNSQPEDSPTWTSPSPASLHNESTVCPTSTDAIPRNETSIETVDCQNPAARPSTVNLSLPVSLPEHTEQKRLSWMKDCIPWSKLSLQNRRKQRGSVRSQRWPRRVPEAVGLPPLCPDSLLQSTGWKSLQQVTMVTLEDLSGCSLSTLALCTQLQSISLRRCGLKSLEGINQLPQLCYIDVQENDISYVDCENMVSLRGLQLGHNKLTSIHGLTGTENLDILDLSHNSLTRIAGLESVKRLQRLSVDHNQLISTKGLRDVYTLLHLNCSHNHLASVEGLENSALLNTLDLRANSLTEPPSLNNQVLLRELHLDDNSISSLQGLIACWLPLMQHLSVAQNRITQLPSMSDFVSLANLDLRFNCVSELQNVCESLKECQLLQKVHLTGNPVEQESGWRSTLQKAVPGLRGIDDQEADSYLSPPAVQQVSLASGSFLTFCQDQLQQTYDLQQKHSRELSDASSSLDAVKTSCRYFTESLQLATDQRFAHEYGDTTVADKHRAAGRTIAEETLDIDSTNVEKHAERPEMESTGKVPHIIPKMGNIRCSSWTFDKKSAAESRPDTSDSVTAGPKTGPTVSKVNSGSVHSLATKGKTISANSEMSPVSKHQNLDLQNTAAVVIQQLWRKYRHKCGNISSPSTAEKGGGRGEDGRKPESGPSYIDRSVVGQDYAATVIQAFWRGFTLRRRLASALAAVSVGDTGEDDTFEEVDLDEFVYDEAALEKHWALPLSEASPPRRYPVSEQPPSLKPPGAYPEPPQYILPPPLVWRSKHAWVAGDQMDSAGQRVSPVSSSRSRSPASVSVVSGLTKRSEMILEEWGFTQSHTALLMLKRAQKMKSKKQQQRERQNPAVRPDFTNCSYQLGPVEACKRQAQYNRNYIKVREAELVLHLAEREQVKQERAQQWLHTQPAHSDRDSESVHFLPEINSDILNGGRVQLVADPGYTQRLHHASGLWANSSLAAQPCEENNYPRRNSLGHARAEIPSPKRVTSAPSKKERISYRDNPVQLSGGWGGGKKRDRVYK